MLSRLTTTKALIACAILALAISLRFITPELVPGIFSDDEQSEATPSPAYVLRPGPDGWTNYHSDEFGFEFSYPSHWHLDSKQLGDNTFVTQNAMVSPANGGEGDTRVNVVVNHQGDWCLGGRIEKRQIVVSGVTGEETVCYYSRPEMCPASQCALSEIAWYFRDVRGRSNYVAVGRISDPAAADALSMDATIRRIVESFRFVD